MEEVYYFGITIDDDWYEEEFEKYKQEFQTKVKLVEYKVKLIEKRVNCPNKNQLCFCFEILEVIKQNEGYFILSDSHKIGTIVYSWFDLKNQTIPFNPQCAINDGGCLNCSGCYRSLVIPFKDYETEFIKD